MLSTEEPVDRWVTRSYATRAVFALVVATLVVGFINGASRAAGDEGLVMMNGVEGQPALFWYRVQFETVGGLVAAVPSGFAVLLRARPTPAAVIRRLLVGPLIAGTLLCLLSAPWGWAPLGTALGMTATACGGFVVAGLLFGLTNVPPTYVRAAPSPSR